MTMRQNLFMASDVPFHYDFKGRLKLARENVNMGPHVCYMKNIFYSSPVHDTRIFTIIF